MPPSEPAVTAVSAEAYYRGIRAAVAAARTCSCERLELREESGVLRCAHCGRPLRGCR